MFGKRLGHHRIAQTRNITHTHTRAHTYTCREANGPNAIKIPEVQVSKQHAEISYSRRRRTFAVVDVGSRNGTILNEKKIRKVQTDRQMHIHTLYP